MIRWIQTLAFRALMSWLIIKPLDDLDACCPVCGLTGSHDDGQWVEA